MKVLVGDRVNTKEAKKEVHNRHCRFTTTVARDEGGYGRGRVNEVVEGDGWDVGEEWVKVHVSSTVFLKVM